MLDQIYCSEYAVNKTFPQSTLFKQTHTLHLSLSPTHVKEGSWTERMIHYCAHCDYNSHHRWCVRRHQSRKHRTQDEEVVEHPFPIQINEQPTDWDLIEDSILVLKIYKLLQSMTNKWCMNLYEFVSFRQSNAFNYNTYSDYIVFVNKLFEDTIILLIKRYI